MTATGHMRTGEASCFTLTSGDDTKSDSSIEIGSPQFQDLQLLSFICN